MATITQNQLDDVNFFAQLLCRMSRTIMKCKELTDNNQLIDWLENAMDRVNGIYSPMVHCLERLGITEFQCDCRANGGGVKTPIWLPKEFGLVASCATCGRKFIWSRFILGPLVLQPDKDCIHIFGDEAWLQLAKGTLDHNTGLVTGVEMETNVDFADYEPIPYDIWEQFGKSMGEREFWAKHLYKFVDGDSGRMK